MNFNQFAKLLDDFYSKPWKFRMKLFSRDHPTNWQTTAIWIPTDHYVENHGSLTSFSDLEHIEIDPIEDNEVKLSISKRNYDHTKEVFDIIKFHMIDYETNGRIIRIKIQ